MVKQHCLVFSNSGRNCPMLNKRNMTLLWIKLLMIWKEDLQRFVSNKWKKLSLLSEMIYLKDNLNRNQPLKLFWNLRNLTFKRNSLNGTVKLFMKENSKITWMMLNAFSSANKVFWNCKELIHWIKIRRRNLSFRNSMKTLNWNFK